MNTEHKSLLILILAIQITPHSSECSHNIYIETIDGGFRQAIPALRITIFWQQDTIYYAAHTIIHTNLSHLTGHRSQAHGENNLYKMNNKLNMKFPDVLSGYQGLKWYHCCPTHFLIIIETLKSFTL